MMDDAAGNCNTDMGMLRMWVLQPCIIPHLAVRGIPNLPADSPVS